MNYKYNELEYAEIIYNNGFQSKYIYTELRLLVLYFRDILGMKPKEREFNLYKFCSEHIPKFKKENYYKSINKALKEGSNKQQKLITISKVDIYKSELDYINSFEINQDYKKVMLTFLVQLKLNKIIYEYKYNKKYNMQYFYGGKVKYNSIKKMSNIPKSMSLNDEVINSLNNLKLITILHRGKISLDYINNCKHEGEIAIEITDFENVGLYLDYYNNIKGIIECSNCNKITKVNSNRQKYCPTCWKEYRNNYQKELMRKIRNN
jgi:hypothetical protein